MNSDDLLYKARQVSQSFIQNDNVTKRLGSWIEQASEVIAFKADEENEQGRIVRSKNGSLGDINISDAVLNSIKEEIKPISISGKTFVPFAMNYTMGRSWTDTDNGNIYHTGTDVVVQRGAKTKIEPGSTIQFSTAITWRASDNPMGLAGYDKDGRFLRALYNVSIRDSEAGNLWPYGTLYFVENKIIQIPKDVYYISLDSYVVFRSETKGRYFDIAIQAEEKQISLRDAVSEMYHIVKELERLNLSKKEG